MKRLIALMICAVSLGAAAQITYPYNPDGNADGQIAEMSMSIENFNDDDGMGNEGIIYPSGEVNDGIGGAYEMPIFIQVPIANQ